MQVLANRLVGGEEPVVGIQAGRLRMVIAGAEMAIPVQAPRFAPHDHDQLGVGLVAHHSVHDVRAGLLQPVGERDVGGLLEARHELDDDRDFLARAGGIDERIDDGRVRSGPVQRLLDREHLRVGRRLAQEVDHRREAVEGMVQQDVLLADRLKEVLMSEQPLRHGGYQWRVLEILAVHEFVHRHQPVEIHRPVHGVVVVRVECEALEKEIAQPGRAVTHGLEPHRVAVAARSELALDGAQQILGFLVVHPQFGIARHPELVAALHFHACKELADEAPGDLRQVGEIDRAGRAGGEADDARQRARQLHDGERGAAPEGVAARELDHEVLALVLDAREGPGGVEAERRQDRLDLMREVVGEPLPLFRRPFAGPEHAYALAAQRRHQAVVQQPVLPGNEAQ